MSAFRLAAVPPVGPPTSVLSMTGHEDEMGGVEPVPDGRDVMGGIEPIPDGADAIAGIERPTASPGVAEPAVWKAR